MRFFSAFQLKGLPLSLEFHFGSAPKLPNLAAKFHTGYFKIMKNGLLFLFALLMFSQPASATYLFGTPPDLAEIKRQAPAAIEQQARQFYQQEDFNNAYYYYLALSQVRPQITVAQQYRLGKSALLVGDYTVAADMLGNLKKYSRRYPLVAFEYANALKFAGKYEEAIAEFEQYATEHKDEKDNPYLAFAQNHIGDCKRAIRDQKVQALAQQNAQVIESNAQIRAITATSRFGYRLAEYQDKNGTCIVRLNHQNEAEPLESNISNVAFRSSSPCLAPDGETIYFTRPEKNGQGTIEYKIFTARITASGEVVGIQKLSSGVNRSGYSSLHPAIGFTAEGQEILYFTSTMPGGNGGFDIWYATRIRNNEFTQAYHTGMRINSPNDEITPHYYQAAGELYFSSNRVDGHGGFDVYKLTGDYRKWEEYSAVLLPEPINSAGDDYFYRQDAATNQTYLTTNRFDGKTDQTVQFRQLMRAQLHTAKNEENDGE